MTLEEQADILAANIEGWEDRTLERVGKSIGRRGKMSAAQAKQINNIVEAKGDMNAIMKDLARVTGQNVSQIEKMYGNLLAEQHLANMPLYDYRGKTFVPYAENKYMQAIVKSYAKTTANSMVNISRSSALCIKDERGHIVKLQKSIQNALDKATMAVTSGAEDFHTAMRDTIKTLGGSGVRVDYGGGVSRRLDTAVRQNLLYGAKQASIEYNNMIGAELDCDGIEIDYHANPRPSHEFMQGKQYVLGNARVVNGEYYESADKALDALDEYGCQHYKTPIIIGVSEPRYSENELARLKAQDEQTYDIDGVEKTGYQVSQDMRQLETATREQKRIRDIARASGDKEAVKECNERIKAIRERYDDIANEAGITPDYKRMGYVKG